MEQTTVTYIIRDHDRVCFESRKKEFEHLVCKINAEYGEGTAALELHDQYYNMREKIEPVMHIIDTAFKAMEAVGVEPHVKAIRGGTDGAQLSFKGLPCPNIFAGGPEFPRTLRIYSYSEYGESHECYRQDSRTRCR